MESFTNREQLPHPGIAIDEQIVFNDAACRFVGVFHRPDTFLDNQEHFEEIISKADVLISELYPQKNETVTNSDMVEFYTQIAALAKKQDVPMVVPDPEKDFSDAVVNRGVDLAGAIAGIGSAGYLAVRSLDAKPKSTRRDFLRGAAATTVGALAGTNALAAAYREAGGSLKDSMLNDYYQSSLDYRDTCIAQAIQHFSNIYNNIVVIYGAAHFDAVRQYLQDPELLEKKSSSYAHTFGVWSPAKTEVFDWHNSKLETDQN